MWVDRKHYDALREDYIRVQEKARVLDLNYTALMTTLDWMRVRVTQLEMERAQLIFNYTGVKMPTPVIRSTVEADKSPINAIPNFNDIGDAEAAKLGIGWNDDGTLKYDPPK